MMTDAIDLLAESLRKTRMQLGVSADDFAAELGISRERLAEIESGRAHPGVEVLLAMILSYGLVPDELQAAASQDREVERLLKNLPRLREVYRAVRSGLDSRRPTDRSAPRRREARSSLRGRELVKIEVTERQVSLRWQVDHVDPKSLAAAREFLASGRHGDRAVVLNFLKLGWAEERYASSAASLERIEQIQAYRDVALLPVTRIHRLSLSEVPTCAPLLRRAFATYGSSDWFDCLRDGPLSRYGLFFNRTNRSDAPTFAHVGPSSALAHVLGQDWRRRAVGTPSDSAFTDRRFDRRVSSSYQLSLSSGEAFLDHIVGLVDMGPRHVWLPYQRLLLPDGDRLACFAKVSQNLACPLFAA